MYIGENYSGMLQRKIPPKLKDSGSFTIPCMIGKIRTCKAMLELGVSMNAMPYSIYSTLNLGTLKEANIVIQLVDRFNVYPKEVLEDVLV